MSDDVKRTVANLIDWSLKGVLGLALIVIWNKSYGAAPRNEVRDEVRNVAEKVERVQRSIESTRVELSQRLTRVETQVEGLKR